MVYVLWVKSRALEALRSVVNIISFRVRLTWCPVLSPWGDSGWVFHFLMCKRGDNSRAWVKMIETVREVSAPGHLANGGLCGCWAAVTQAPEDHILRLGLSRMV